MCRFKRLDDMKYRIINKNVGKWWRLTKMYEYKAESCAERNGKNTEKWIDLSSSASIVFRKKIEIYVEAYWNKRIKKEGKK